jgi:hypothetical protein
MVFLRHQNFWDNPTVWRRIFDSGLERLHDSGLLVITSYFDKEHELAVKAITNTGARLIDSVRNRASRRLNSTGKSVDRHIAVFRRSL